MGALAECKWSGFHRDSFELHTFLEYLSTNLTTVIDSLAPLQDVRPIKGFDPRMDADLIILRCKRIAALRESRQSRREKYCKKFERLRDELNSRSALACDAFIQKKILHAMDNNKNGVWRELRYLGLLPKQQEKLHGIEPQSLNSHFASVSTTDARVTKDCNKVISQASEEGFQFSAVSSACLRQSCLYLICGVMSTRSCSVTVVSILQLSLIFLCSYS